MITRKTQWDFPSDVDKEGEIMMDLATPDNSFSEHEDEEETVKLVNISIETNQLHLFLLSLLGTD